MSIRAAAMQNEPAIAISPVSAGERVEGIDVLRSFTLLEVMMGNMGAFKGSPFGNLSHAGSFDQTNSWLIAFGFQAKFYVLFRFLFGYG